MIEGSGPIYPISFLRFSKTFLTISMDAIYNCNRLDFWTLFTTVIDWILIQIIHLLLINNTYHH